MVWQREDVGAQVGAARDQGGLGGGAEVAREQHAEPAGLGAHDERRVVVGNRAGEIRRRPERRHDQVAGARRRRSRAALDDRYAARARGRAHRFELRVAFRAERQPDLGDVDGGQHRGRTAPMVDIRVRHHEHVHPPDAERAERRHHHIAPPVELGERAACVHEERAALALDQRGVALPHVEEDRAGRRRRHALRGPGRQHDPRAERRASADGGAARGESCGGERQRGRERGRGGGSTGRWRREPAVGDTRGGERCRRHPLAKARDRPRRLRLRRHRQRERGEERRRQEHRARPGDRDQVGGEPGRRRDAELPGRERRGHETRGRARPDGRLDPPGGPARVGSTSREDEARRRREGELGSRLEERLGLDRQDCDRRRAQGVRAGSGPRARRRERQRQQHREGPPHRDLPAARERVADRQRHRRSERGPPDVAPCGEAAGARQEPTRRRVGEPGDQREMQPRHREEMCEPEPCERLAVLRCEPGAVAERERAQEAGAGSSAREPVAERAAPALERRAR